MATFPNPFFAFIELWIGEVNITLMPPQHVQQFTYQRHPQNSANKFIIALFDETALLVEAQLVSGNQQVKFRYGYVNGTESPVYQGIVNQYDIDFNPAGAILTIEGISDSVSTYSNPKSATYSGKTIDKIVEEIAAEEEWTLGVIVPCEPVSDGVNENKTFQRNNQTAQEFIVSELIPNAKSADTGDSDYLLNFEDVAGDTVVNFYPQIQVVSLDRSVTHNYEFTWGAGDPNTQVVDFNPDYSGTLVLMSGGATVDSTTIDRISNSIINMRFSNTNDPNRVVLAEKSGYDYQGATRYIGGSAQSFDEMKKTAAYLWYINANNPVTAELTILGDPLIQAFDNISVVMLNKDGLPHHSSGVYCITEIEDDIVGDTFLTKLILIRNAMNIGLNDAGGVDINLSLDLSMLSNSALGNLTNANLTGVGNSDIVNIALSQEGYVEQSGGYTKYGDWYADGFEKSAWCAMFVAWCAEQAGISNDIVTRTASCDTFKNFFINKNQWVASRSQGGPDYTPKAGDIILFSDSHSFSDATHVGIVVRSDGSNVYTIEGNTSDSVAQRTYSITSDYIIGYGLPAYVSSLSSNGVYDVGGSTQQTIFNFCTQVMGLNNAAACGVLANIEKESNFNTGAHGDGGTSYGICQWHASRKSDLISWCTNNGYDYSSLEGQLYFMNHELNNSESKTLNKLRTISNTSQGSYDAGYYWCLYFERPAGGETSAKSRGNLAQSKYYPTYG